MLNSKPISNFLSLTSFSLFLLSLSSLVSSKSTIEACTNLNSCNAMVGYTLYTDLKVSEVATIFGNDPIALLTANAIDISFPNVENHILPSKLFLKVPVICSCVDGIRKSVSINYKTRPSDSLSLIAEKIYGGLVSVDQLREANSLADEISVLDVGQNLVVPLPCTCFNNTDDSLPAVYLSYVVQSADTLAGIAAMYQTTVTDLMNVNAMGSADISSGDILSVPLSACTSNFPSDVSDYGLIVPNGSYAISASHCVQCSCSPRSRNLYCMPTSLPVSCSSMQCQGSNLMLGNSSVQKSSGGCNVTSCNYDGYANGTIRMTLSSSLQPRCPASQQFLALTAPPTTATQESINGLASAPSASPLRVGGARLPGSISAAVLPPSGSFPTGGPASSTLRSATSGSNLVNPFAASKDMVALFVFIVCLMACHGF